MNLIKWAFDRTISKYKTYIAKAEAALSHLPKKDVYIKRSKGSLQVYRKERNEDGMMVVRYISKNTRDIDSLLRAKYYKKCLQIAKKYLNLLMKIQNIDLYEEIFLPEPLENVWTQWPKEFRTFDPLALSEEDYKEKWRQVKYDQKDPPEENKGLDTEKGDYVRSKSEREIANRLFNKGIAYRYEQTLEMGGHFIHPDFTILNSRTRHEIIWEHFGMMDKDEYLQSAIERIKGYLNNGFLIGRDLVFTYETSTAPLQSDVIEDMIKALFQ